MQAITSKTPLRISFVGGGTDLPWFYEKHDGTVISTTIDKYIKVSVERGRNDCIYINEGGLLQYAADLEAVENPYVREALRRTGMYDSVLVTIQSDVGERGTGLGTSSALTVGLLNALYTLKDSTLQYKTCYRETLARQACKIEIDILGNPIGKQDQYAVAYGGFNRIHFAQADNVRIEALKPPPQFQKSLMLFNTGIARDANKVLAEQKQAFAVDGLLKIKTQVWRFGILLEDEDIDEMGLMLHEMWGLKKSLAASISNKQVDAIYDRAFKAGAMGGKVLGAGGGGYMLFMAYPEHQQDIITALDGLAEYIPFGFETKGSHIV